LDFPLQSSAIELGNVAIAKQSFVYFFKSEFTKHTSFFFSPVHFHLLLEAVQFLLNHVTSFYLGNVSFYLLMSDNQQTHFDLFRPSFFIDRLIKAEVLLDNVAFDLFIP